jgi:acetyl-CoA acetyltransferase
MTSPVAGAAMALDLYCRRYGQDREKLAAVPMVFRRHALLNADAVAKEPLTLEAYQTARPIIDPIRLYDCSLVGDGAVCVIVTAQDLVQASNVPVLMTGFQGVRAGRDSFIFAPWGLGVAQQSETRLTLAQTRTQAVYDMAGAAPESVDVLGVYDSFSPLAVYTLEDFGFCAAGEGLDFIQDGRIELGGQIPTNLNGGQLSHAQVNGWGQIRELILQLRGQAEGRQVAGARRGLWATVAGDALMFERD